MTFQKKNAVVSTGSGGTPEPARVLRGYADGKRYLAALNTLKSFSDQLVELKESLGESVAEVTQIEEDRRREGATYAFDLKLERDKQLALITQEDAGREAAFTARDQALTAAENDFAELINVAPVSGDHLATGKALRGAFEAAIRSATAKGEHAGKAEAAVTYTTQKKVDVAEAAQALALLTQKNAHLEAMNADLKAQNAALVTQNGKLTESNADVAKTGLNAAAGVVKQGNESLSTAASAPGGRPIR